MKILVLGGTGAMGAPLVDLLVKNNHEVYVTSRTKKISSEKMKYIYGNAKELNFLVSLLKEPYDAIIDFMVYSSQELKIRLPIFLENTKQYFFFSSARVYANCETALREDSVRLLDGINDATYLSTDEYALAKAREENLLFNSGRKNWTIIRPYITYNKYRLQLGVYEKENWLRRALNGNTIVFPKDIAQKTTSLTYGDDVALLVADLIGKEEAFGEAFHIVTSETITWNEVLECYLNVIERRTGKRSKVLYVDDSEDLQKVWNPWQIKYDRLYNRIFDNSKIENLCGKFKYKKTLTGLEECLNDFLDNPKWLGMNWKYEAYCDKVAKEKINLHEIPGMKTKIKYLKWRCL